MFDRFAFAWRAAMGRAAIPIKHAGSIGHDVRNRTWAVKIELNRKTHVGPRRSSKAEAKADLAKGRTTTSRQAFARLLKQLTLTAGRRSTRSSAPQLASLKPKKMSSSDAHPAAKRRHVRTNIRKKHAMHPDSLVCGLCDGKVSALAAALIQELLHNVGLPRRA